MRSAVFSFAGILAAIVPTPARLPWEDRAEAVQAAAHLVKCREVAAKGEVGEVDTGTAYLIAKDWT